MAKKASSAIKALHRLTVTAIAEQPIYSLPTGHNKDDGMVNLLEVKPDLREKRLEQDTEFDKTMPRLNSASRLRASILNSVEDPSTRMSSVEEDAGSTSVDNLEETNIAPSKKTADATFDSLDVKPRFEESHTPSNSAYAKAGSALSKALAVFDK